jgi:hypothetical protein
MWDDPIVAEVRKTREAHAARFNCDLDAIYRDLKSKEQSSGRTYVRYPPKPARVAGKASSAETR